MIVIGLTYIFAKLYVWYVSLLRLVLVNDRQIFTSYKYEFITRLTAIASNVNASQITNNYLPIYRVATLINSQARKSTQEVKWESRDTSQFDMEVKGLLGEDPSLMKTMEYIDNESYH